MKLLLAGDCYVQFLWVYPHLQGRDVMLDKKNICVFESVLLPTASHSGRGVEGRPPESVWPADEGPCYVLRSGPPSGH